MSHKLGYVDRAALEKAIDLPRLHPRDEVIVQLADGSYCHFHFMNLMEDTITGVGKSTRLQVMIDLEHLTLTELRG